MKNFGIIGLGYMAATHIKALRKVRGARLAAICSPSGKRLDGDFSDVAGNVGTNDPLKVDMSEVKAYTDFHAMLADEEIHVIDICTPTTTHRDLAVTALRAGKDVICEKPLARTSEECREIAAAAEKNKRLMMPAMCLRFWPEWRWLLEAVKDQRFGKVLSAKFTRIAEPPAWGHGHFHDGRKSGGALLDLHVHDIDFIRACFGHPKSVSAQGYSKFSGAIDHIIGHYEVEGGAMVHAEGGWAMSPGFGFNMSYLVNFENATVSYDSGRGKECLKVHQNGSTEVITCDDSDGYIGELQHFVDVLGGASLTTAVDAEDGIGALLTCEAALRSIQQQRRVTVEAV
jgi:predicted dehydrogenase